jgi:transposase
MDASFEALPDDVDALKAALIAERRNVLVARSELLQAEALAAIAQAQVADAHAVIEDLKLRIAKALQDKWGRSSERHKHLLDQLEMQLEDVVTSATEDELAAEMAVTKANAVGVPVAPFTRKKPVRGPLPDHLPRRRVVVPAPETCPCCQSADLKKIGETVTESREVVPRQWIVVQTVREKFACKACATITQPPAPFHPIPRGSAGPNLLAMILFNKFALHQPLNRQSETYAAEGVSLSVSTLADYVGHCTILLRGLVELIEAHVLAGERIHHDDTTVPVMAAGKTITGRIWASVRDDRPFGGADPPAVVYYYTRDRTGAHPQRQLASYTGILQADAYGGYDALYERGRKPGPIVEAACWSHARRPFYKEARLSGAPLAREAVTRMDAIFAAEREIWGRSADERLAWRQVHVAPLVADLELWLRQQYARVSRKGDLAKAINYMLSRWDSFARFVSDGRICMTNNAAERRVRTVAVGRRNWTFCGSDRGGDRAAAMYTLVQTCRLNGVDPHAWLADIIARISDHSHSRLHELLPWEWKARQPQPQPIAQAA